MLKLLNSTVLWCCLFFNFTQFVILEHLPILDLALSGGKGLSSNLSLDDICETSDSKQWES